MQLLAQRQARAAAQRRSGHTKCVAASVRRGAAVRGPARLVAGSRRVSVRVQAEVQAAPSTASPLSVGTIALRKAVAQAAYKGSSVFVTGGQGQLSIRIIRELLAAGFKVTAGVTDLDAANAAFAFFKRYELMDKAAAANLKLVPLESLEGDEAAVKALPKRAKVVVVDGDVEGKGKTGAKEIQFSLALAEATSASQVVLVSTQPVAPAAGGTGLFGGLFGGPAKTGSQAGPLDRLGKLEQQVADSGKPYVIVRAYGSERTDDGAEPGSYLQIGTLGTVPTSAVASKAQVASVVSEVLKAAGPTNGLVFEVAATPEEQLSAADAIGEIIAAAEAAAAEAAAAAAEEAAKSSSPAMGIFSLGTMSVLRKAAAATAEQEKVAPEPEQEPEPEQAKKVGTGFFGFGAKKAVAAAEEPAEKVEAPAVGTLSARRAAAAKQKAKEQKATAEADVVVVEGEPKKTDSGFFGFGTAKVAVKKAAPKEEEEVVEAPKKSGSGFFGFGTVKVAVKEAPKEEEAKEEEQPPKKASTGFFGFGTAKVAVKEAPKEEEAKEQQPPKKASTGFFGFGTAKVAVKKPAEEEEEAPAPRRAVRASSRTPPPPPPSPKRSAPSSGTSVRDRAAPPPTPEPAPVKRGTSVRRIPEPTPEPPKRANTTAVRVRAPEPEPPKRAASASPSAGSSRSAPPSGTSRTSTGTSRVSTSVSSSSSSSRNASSSASRSSRSAPAEVSPPTYAPGTRGARLAAQKAEQQQQRRK